MIFDAASRDNCEVQRQNTSTPLQSLTLMNNPEFQKAALHLSSNVYKMDIDIYEKITKLYRTITGRSPNKNELSKLKNILMMKIQLTMNQLLLINFAC